MYFACANFIRYLEIWPAYQSVVKHSVMLKKVLDIKYIAAKYQS